MPTVNNFFSHINSIKHSKDIMTTPYDTIKSIDYRRIVPPTVGTCGQSPEERESVKVLRECIELQNAKGSDYQSKASSVRQADYYVNGVQTIHDIMHAKMLRMKSVMDKIQAGESTNFESLEDSAKDLINYASFFVAYSRGKIDGQNPEKNIFNK
ncbi:hypothetical protein CPT_Muldoon_041 [Serratia phage Muldoon]|uniref:Nucleotide modification associated domain-containing protein n=1 Tax=Serratia phage Muldoon TaxID=2601678 RepID=A0A5P8PH22_9CAUD|nr:hypothetical protein HYP94_gp040 [Serratia phage Muldoon]QFR55997.1 hypothetical protein CPT_Muldoon_041 [Serratia phage Muldoon]